MATNIFIGKKQISTSNSGSSDGTGNGLTPEQELKINTIKINGGGEKALFDDGTYQDVVTQDELDDVDQSIDDIELDIETLKTNVLALNNGVADISVNVSNLETTLVDHELNTNVHLSSADRNLLNSLNHNKGTFESEANLRATYPTANAGDYCICFNGTNYTMWTYSTDWVDTGVLGNVTSVNNLTGDITLDANNINYETGVTLKDEIDKKLNTYNVVQGDNIIITEEVNGDVKFSCDITFENITEDEIDGLF